MKGYKIHSHSMQRAKLFSLLLQKFDVTLKNKSNNQKWLKSSNIVWKYTIFKGGDSKVLMKFDNHFNKPKIMYLIV
jgi:hypothetical protein